MLLAARRAPNLLPESRRRIIQFLHSQFNDDGGARDRSGQSDLYYTVFALDALAAMQVEHRQAGTLCFLRSFGDGEGLDLVHRTCLARCWASMPPGELDAEKGGRILRGIESHRSADGGYNQDRGSGVGTVYDCFLSLGAYQDLGAEPPASDTMGACLAGLRTDDGAYANDRTIAIGNTPTTAGAVTLLIQLGLPVAPETTDWLSDRFDDRGGSLAIPGAPVPDLLSTASALHALASADVALEKNVRDRAVEFVRRLGTGRGFCGSEADETPDSEYTFYALLALGHLSR